MTDPSAPPTGTGRMGFACAVASCVLGALSPVPACIWWIDINRYLAAQGGRFNPLLLSLVLAVGAFVLGVVSLRWQRGRGWALAGMTLSVVGIAAVIVAVGLLVVGLLRWAGSS